MQVGDPEEEIEKVAQAGIRGMVGALGRETISPHVMIDAALHVLAAWVASSQAHSPVSERGGGSRGASGDTAVVHRVPPNRWVASGTAPKRQLENCQQIACCRQVQAGFTAWLLWRCRIWTK